MVQSLLNRSLLAGARQRRSEVVAYAPIGNAGVTCCFPYSKAKLRLGLYGLLMALDVGAILLVGRGRGAPAALLLLFGLVAPRMGSYGLRALERPREGALRVAVSAAAAALMAGFLAHVFNQPGDTPARLVRDALVLALAMFAARLAAALLFAKQVGGYVNELVLVDGEPSRDFGPRVVLRAEALGLEPSAGGAEMLNRIGHLLQHCDRVAIDAPAHRRALWMEALRGIDVDIELVSGELDEQRPIELRTLEGGCTLLMRRGALSPASRATKRAFDIALALVALPAALPVMAALAVLIKLETPGPMLFRQWRVGRGNRQFEILKFRTMRHGAVDILGHQSATPQDGRVTRLGRVMRQTSLDELPQLFNVLLGDMSIVGPRPHPIGCRADRMLFWHIDPAYWERHAIKPGMTGLAQVRGFRGATHTTADLTDRLRSDIEYISGWSLMLDVLIVLRTVRVLVHRNAY